MKPKVCPTCGQPLPQARGHRVCADCGKRMGNRDKWFIGGDGKLHHKNCENPISGNPVGTTEAAPNSTMELLEVVHGQ